MLPEMQDRGLVERTLIMSILANRGMVGTLLALPSFPYAEVVPLLEQMNPQHGG